MEIPCRRIEDLETRLLEMPETLARPGVMRRRYEQQAQRTVLAPSRPNKRSCKGITEIDAELIRRANRRGGGHQPLQNAPEEAVEEEDAEFPEDGEIENEQNPVDIEEDSVILRGDNLPIVDLAKYKTEGKEAHYIQINHIVNQLTTKKLREKASCWF